MTENDQQKAHTSQNVVVRFVKNWVMIWYTIAKRLARPLGWGALMMALAFAFTIYVMVPMLAYTVYHYGWGALLTSAEYEMDGVLILVSTLVWVATTASIAVAAAKTYEGENDG